MQPLTTLTCPSPCRPHLLLGGLLFGAALGTACSYEAQVSRGLRPSPDSGAPALMRAGCDATQVPPGCGDPCGDGVVVSGDVSTNTVWDCPVYTLLAPVFVHGSSAEPTRLVIAAGTVVKGRPGSLEQGLLPGALIVTRSGRIDARGTRAQPIIFTSAAAVGERAPGDWGGVVLLGRAPTNVPVDFENSGNRAGEMFIEGLPRVENTTYGTGVDVEPADAGTTGGAPTPPEVGPQNMAQSDADPNHDCGTLRFVRIEFAGFAVSDTNELNGLTVGGCGRYTVLDYIQVHLGSDDGIEFFGGTTDLKHAVITGAQDDSLDWDQGWRGRAQFLAIQQHDDSGGAIGQADNGFEGDGYADPERITGTASSPSMYNVTLLSSRSSVRGLRLREGTELVLYNSIVASAEGGPAEGLIELSDAATVDQLALQRTRVNHSIFSGPWPRSGQADSNGKPYLEEDYFTAGEGSLGNTVLSVEQMAGLVPGAFEPGSPHWVPVRGSYASSEWVVPSDSSGLAPFFETSANFRGAFDPSGDDWTAGWTAYPAN